MEQKRYVVLVNEHGNDLFDQYGRIFSVEKMEAHRLGLLHRAVSVFIFNGRDELLLQKRALHKYHSPGKWTNTCCTHPSPSETPIVTARRRLKEEMGLITVLSEAFTFVYRADVGNNLVENEFDHVFIGLSNRNPQPNPAEVCDWSWANIEHLKQELIRYPEKYSVWLQRCLRDVIKQRGGYQTDCKA